MKRIVRRAVRTAGRTFRPDATALASLKPIVDADWYLRAYPDVAAAKLDPADHFVRTGAREGRRPNRFFDPIWYLQQNPGAAGRPPIFHYARVGRQLGLDPGPNFSALDYLAAYPDVKASGIEPLDHFIRYGQRENRQAFPSRAGGTGMRTGAGRYAAGPRLDDGEVLADETLARVYEVLARHAGAIDDEV